jgi:hypothetical protein
MKILQVLLRESCNIFHAKPMHTVPTYIISQLLPCFPSQLLLSRRGGIVNTHISNQISAVQIWSLAQFSLQLPRRHLAFKSRMPLLVAVAIAPRFV